jgi:hypothetical protein
MSRRTALAAAKRAQSRGESLEAVCLAYLGALDHEDNPRPKGGASETRARIGYRIKHWGLGGKGKLEQLRCADPRKGVYTKLGDLVAVSYATEKGGDGGPAIYDHEFSRRLPELLYSESGEGLVIAGGSYRVTARGIVG